MSWVRLDFEFRQGPLSEQAHGMRHEMIILHVRNWRLTEHGASANQRYIITSASPLHTGKGD